MLGTKIEKISKAFGNFEVLKEVSLDVGDGEFLTLLGPSGCGKSTLLRIIAGLEYQTSGSIHIGNRVVDDLRPAHRNVAMVFQSYALYPYMNVEENIALPLVMRRLNAVQRIPIIGRRLPGSRAIRSEIREQVQTVAGTLGLGHLLHRKPGQLSGGQRQRVALGRAMVRQPEVFLMDEPLSNLDAKLRVQMREEITDLHRRLKTTFIFVTHDQTEAMTMSDRIAVMMDGEVIQIGTPNQVYSDPEDIRVAQFIGSPQINIFDEAAIDTNRLRIKSNKLIKQKSGIRLAIRPEDITIVDKSRDGAFAVKIRYVENLGSEALVHLTLGDGTKAVARLNPEETGHLTEDSTAFAFINERAALLFDGVGKRIRPANSENSNYVRKIS